MTIKSAPLALAAVLAPALIVAGAAIHAQSSAKGPLVRILDRFTAASVSKMGDAEIAVPARAPLASTASTPADLPGKGLAQHPMVYIGEGDNTIYVVDNGKVIWTFQTGVGWELDDVWLMSNGNVLFSRMSYIEEVTPDKNIVWHRDAPAGTEIHGCQPIGLDRVLLIE
ncbi:MAG: hypothetical protein ABJC89_17325, partial [Acidobacteriota bacterium]